MNSFYHSYPYKKSLLMAVPAVHHHTIFAEQVNNICRDPQQRPDAIAVELGHALVLELVSFLRELKQADKEKIPLPCMLGIMKRNRFIHTGQSEKALLLQKFYRLPLYNLPDDLLAERLNFSKWSTIFISPADSIIEAIRCSIELDIPVYGVDLSDFAATSSKHYSIEDPQCARNNLKEYGTRILKYCSSGRDPRIDLNRETFMASGLKYCLSEHRKVLFTCGMAHWVSIASLLDNVQIPPYPVYKIAGESEFRRVIVHPSLAAPVMEIIPQYTFEYEQWRQPVTIKIKKKQTVKPETMIRNCLDAVYKEYTASPKPGQLNNSESGYWSNIGIYEQYLFRLSAVRQRMIPDFSTMLASARAMMDDSFCRLLTQKLMDVNPEWASTKDFPDLPVINQIINKNANQATTKKKVRIEYNNPDGVNEDTDSEMLFYTRIPDNQNIDPPDINAYWKWKRQKIFKWKENTEGNPWIWPPCESLIYGIAFKAAEISLKNQKRIHDSSAFDGSLEGGVDVKATIRSIIRSEKKIYVSKLASALDQAIMDGVNPDPFVLMFPETSDLSSGQWSFYTAGSDLGNFVKDRGLFERITNEKGNVFASSILLEEKITPPSHLRSLVFEMSKTHGTLMFGNPCINAKQSAIWLETTGYKCCPILPDYGMYSLMNYYYDHYDLQINLSDWQESLIRMAIPFAKKIVTIIAPDSFCLPERVKREASHKRVQLNIVSYSNFSETQIEEARHRFSVRTLDRAGLHFPPETEVLLGQKKETYFEMLPYEMRKQVGYDESLNR